MITRYRKGTAFTQIQRPWLKPRHIPWSVRDPPPATTSTTADSTDSNTLLGQYWPRSNYSNDSLKLKQLHTLSFSKMWPRLGDQAEFFHLRGLEAWIFLPWTLEVSSNWTSS